MTISWYGEACFLLESGGTRVLIEPPQKESGINPPRLKSDVLMFSRPGKSREEAANGAFVIDGPGEYEVGGVRVLGIADSSTPSTSSGQASSEQTNILYNIEIDGVKISHFGFLNGDLDNEKMDLINEPDIALVPVGNGEVLDAEAAMKLINKLEPSIAIPMLYDIKGLKMKRAPIAAFLKESEAKEPPQPKLTIKKKDINEEEIKIVILEKV